MKTTKRFIAAMDRDLPDYNDSVLKVIEVGSDITPVIDDYHFMINGDDRIYWKLPGDNCNLW